MKGLVTIIKRYDDYCEISSEHNIVTDGFGINLCNLFSRSNGILENHHPVYFQLGTSAVNFAVADPLVSSLFFGLSAPFSLSDYGNNTSLDLETLGRSYMLSDSAEVKFAVPSSLVFSSTSGVFAKTVDNGITSIFQNSFEVSIILDKNTANDKIITEIGLFVKNPHYNVFDAPMLIAYKQLDAIEKTSDFTIEFNWRISFATTSLISF